MDDYQSHMHLADENRDHFGHALSRLHYRTSFLWQFSAVLKGVLGDRSLENFVQQYS